MDYSELASNEAIAKTIDALAAHNMEGIVVENGNEALEKVKELIPEGSSVMNGASQTLKQIGFIDYLQASEHGWVNLHEVILAEKDQEKQARLRKESALSDFYLGSVHAVTEEGEYVVGSNTGSQLPHIVNTSQNLILVVSTKKIVSNLADAMNRLNAHVVPLEDVRSKEAYGAPTQLNKIVISKGENPMLGRKVYIILVKEDLGF